MKTKIPVRFPSLRAVTSALVAEQKSLRRLCSKEDLTDGESDFIGTDLRLQVKENGNWYTHSGPSDYDQDHRGFWGSSCLPYGRANLREIARDLLEQAKDSHAEEESALQWQADRKEERLLRGAGLHASQV